MRAVFFCPSELNPSVIAHALFHIMPTTPGIYSGDEAGAFTVRIITLVGHAFVFNSSIIEFSYFSLKKIEESSIVWFKNIFFMQVVRVIPIYI